MIAQEVLAPAFTISLSKRLEQDRHNILPQRCKLIRDFIKSLFLETNRLTWLATINQFEEAVMALHYKSLDKEINHELNIVLYEIFNEFVLSLRNMPREKMIATLVDHYNTLQWATGLLSQLLQYWQVSYLSGKETRTIHRIALNIMHKQISNQHPLEEAIIEAILRSIQEYRDDRVSNVNKQLIEFTLETGIFRKSIEAEFIQRSKNYYLTKRDKLPTNIDFIRAVQRQLQKEQYLMGLIHPSENTVHIVEKQFIFENLEEMVNFLDFLISHDRKDELRLIWHFFQKVGKVDMLECRLEELIHDSQKFIKEGRIDKLIAHKLRLEKMVESSLNNDKSLQQFIASKFETVISQQFTACNELMVKFIVESFRGSMVQEVSEEIASEILKLNPGLDIFLEAYRQKLARQILASQDINIQRHIAFIEKAREHGGSGVVAPIEKMLGDVWRHNFKIEHKRGVFSCLMLFKMHWPKFETYGELNIPDSMRLIRNDFEEAEAAEHPFKEITWISSIGLCHVEIGGVNHVFTELQTSIVIYVSKAIRPMKQQELATVLKIDATAVYEAINKLFTSGILVSHGSSHAYQVNFENRLQYKSYIELPEANSDLKGIGVDRDISVEACLIRLLKARKVIQKSSVFQEVISMIRHFKPTIEQMNNCIKKLAGKDYVKIVGNSLHYLP